MHGPPAPPDAGKLPENAAGLVDLAAAGSVRATARLLSRLETGGSAAAQISAAITGRTRAAAVWGLTGPPGVGKSTLTAALISDSRAAGRRVAVLAVDPSSPFSGGALLGDRVRMSEHVTDPGVFIRSMASRGHLGGLSPATPAAVDLMAAIGFDVVMVETVGVGQNEIDVLRLADTVVVVTAPGAGDGIQAAKAGILEIADVLVVNKADREGAAGTVRELKAMIALGRSGRQSVDRWRIPVLCTTATQGTGIPELVQQIRLHAEFGAATGLDRHRRRARSEIAIETLVLERLHRLLRSDAGRTRLAAAAAELADSAGDANVGAAALWRWLAAQPSGPTPSGEVSGRAPHLGQEFGQ
jgi:LAO/AO transport system kinase